MDSMDDMDSMDRMDAAFDVGFTPAASLCYVSLPVPVRSPESSNRWKAPHDCPKQNL